MLLPPCRKRSLGRGWDSSTAGLVSIATTAGLATVATTRWTVLLLALLLPTDALVQADVLLDLHNPLVMLSLLKFEVSLLVRHFHVKLCDLVLQLSRLHPLQLGNLFVVRGFLLSLIFFDLHLLLHLLVVLLACLLLCTKIRITIRLRWPAHGLEG